MPYFSTALVTNCINSFDPKKFQTVGLKMRILKPVGMKKKII